MKKKRVIYFGSFQDDVVTNDHQDYKIREDYEWIEYGFLYCILSRLIYGLAVFFSFFYVRLVWNLRIVGKNTLKQVKDTGYFMYANHTQPFGDVFLPAWVNLGRRIYVIVSQANYGLPIIGRILSYLGALPIPDDISGMRKFKDAIKTRIYEKKCIVIYPEAHVWPYYTEIRPYSATSFHYPVDLQVPVLSMTTTYKKRRFLKKPKMVIYIDGPFYPDSTLSKREQREKLHRQVIDAMKERSKNSTYQYYQYIKKSL